MKQELVLVKQKDKQEFQIADLLPIGITLVVLGVALAYGIDIMGDVRDDMVTNVASCGLNSTGGTGGTILYTNCGAAYNGTVDAITGVSKLPEKMPMIVTIVVAAVVIGILVRYLFVKTR